MPTLPLWLVTEHIKLSEPDDNHCSKAGSAIAFSTSKKLCHFLAENKGGEWKMSMASDLDGLVIMIADLHRDEISTLCLDPEEDGKGGEQVPLQALMAFAESLRKGQ